MTDSTQPPLFAAMWRYRIMCLVIVALMLELSYAAATWASGGITATATIGLRTPDANSVLAPGLQGDASLGRYTAQRARFMNSDAVMEAVAESVGTTDITSLRRQVHVTPSGTSNIITIVTEGDNAKEAVAIAAAVVEAYGSQTERQVGERTSEATDTLQRQIDAILASADDGELGASEASSVAQLRRQIADLETSRAVTGSGIEFVVEAREDAVVEPGLPVRELALGLIVGLALAASIAWWRADRDRRIMSWAHAAAILDRPLLAEVPRPAVRAEQIDDLVRAGNAGYELLWAAIARDAAHSITLVQGLGYACAADVTVNLAVAASRDHLKVLVVDAETSNTASRQRGLPVAVTAGVSRAADDASWTTIDVGPGRQFSLLTIGTSVDESELSASDVERFAREWRQVFDCVLINVEPMTGSRVTTRWSGAADRIVAVVRPGVDERLVAEFHRQVDLVGSNVVGFAFMAER
jgi:capsular polysaccharide biosynthesis protein